MDVQLTLSLSFTLDGLNCVLIMSPKQIDEAIILRHHPFRKYGKFPEKLAFLTS